MGFKLVSDEDLQKRVTDSYKENDRNDFRDLEDPIVNMQPVYSASTVEKHHMSDNNMVGVVTFTQILVYIISIAITGMYIYVIMQDKFNMYNTLMNLKIYIQLSGIVFIVDSIAINIFYQKDKSLVLFSIFLSFLYPAKRDSATGGRLGTICTIAMTLTFVIIMIQYLVGVSKYGVPVMTLTDAYSTEHAKEFMEQISDGASEKLGDLLSENIKIDTIRFSYKDGKDAVDIRGMGQCYYSDHVFYQEDNYLINTHLVFYKDPDTQKYTLESVQFNNDALGRNSIDIYWERIWLDVD